MDIDWSTAKWDKLKEAYGDILEHNHFIGVDLETTGFSPEKHAEIIEISAIRLDSTDTNKFHKFETLVRPTVKIPKKISTLTSITNDMVQQVKGPTHIMKELFSFLSDGVIVAHNAMFEQRFLDYYMNYNQLFYTNVYFDTMTAMRILFPKTKGFNRLDAFLDIFDIVNDNWHQANSDSLLTLIAFSKLREKYFEHYELEDNLDFHFDDNSFNPEKWRLLNANYWEKSYHTQAGKSRLYVRLSSPSIKKNVNIFYDYKIHDWNYNNQLTRVPLDFSAIEKDICTKYNVDQIEELNPHYYEETATF